MGCGVFLNAAVDALNVRGQCAAPSKELTERGCAEGPRRRWVSNSQQMVLPDLSVVGLSDFNLENSLARYVSEIPDISSHAPGIGPSVRVHKLSQRLHADTITVLVERYTAGATSTELAAEFELVNSSVIKLLRQQGVPIRLPRLSPVDRRQVVALYQQGMSQAEIGRRFGRHPGAIWHLLKRAGVLDRQLH